MFSDAMELKYTDYNPSFSIDCMLGHGKLLNVFLIHKMRLLIFVIVLLWRLYKVLFVFAGFFLGPHLQHMEFPRLGVKLELQLPACATATAMRDLSSVCDLYHSSWDCRILNPLSETRDWTCILMDAGWVC